MKFAKSKYGNFVNSTLGLKVPRNGIFAVTPDIEKSDVYQHGVATKNFIPVAIGNMLELQKVVNLTDDIRAEFAESIKPKVEKVVEEVPEEPPEEPETVPEVPDEPDAPDDPEGEKEIVPNVDDMSYTDLQTYAKELEKKYDVQINRGAKGPDLLKEVKAVLADAKDDKETK